MTKGYLVPTDIGQIENYRCARVWYPDSDFFRYALMGAYTDLAKAYLWEANDPGVKERLQQLWLEAQERTMSTIDEDCDTMALQDLEQRIAEIENMNICVSCCGCGCSGGSINSSDNLPPDGTNFDPPVVIDNTDQAATAAYLCDLGTWLADVELNVYTSMKNLSATGALTATAVQGVLATYPVFVPAWTIAVTIVQYLAAATVYFDAILDNLQLIKDDLICAVAQGGTPVSVKQRWQNVLKGSDTNFLLWVIPYLISELIDWETILAEDGAEIPAAYLGSTCDCGTQAPSGVIVGFGFTVQEFTSEHGNGSLANIEIVSGTQNLVEFNWDVDRNTTVIDGVYYFVESGQTANWSNYDVIAEICRGPSRINDIAKIGLGNENQSGTRWFDIELKDFVALYWDSGTSTATAHPVDPIWSNMPSGWSYVNGVLNTNHQSYGDGVWTAEADFNV